jgi:hypothetical protein
VLCDVRSEVEGDERGWIRGREGGKEEKPD